MTSLHHRQQRHPQRRQHRHMRSSMLIALTLILCRCSDAFASSSHSTPFLVGNTNHYYSNSNNNKYRGGSSSKTTTPKKDGKSQLQAESNTNSDTKTTDSNGFHAPVPRNGKATVSNSPTKAIPVEYVAETKLPTDIGQFQLRAYRIPHPTNRLNHEPCVIYNPKMPPFHSTQPVQVRIHDQCVTSEVFRSQRCDCKEQLHMALLKIQKDGGLIIYLQQEGRGIGLANKVAAYQLQDHGMDTVDANLHLGFPEDMREYSVVPSILEDLGIKSIELMTNNPRKVELLKQAGVDVCGTVPMVVPKTNVHNQKYMESKFHRMHHANLAALVGNDESDILSRNSNLPLYVTDQYINNGTDLTANAIQVSLLVEEEKAKAIAAAVGVDDVQDEDELQGVMASQEDGYCFGRESVEQAIAAMARGEMVVVVDDMDRENEGDFIMAADKCTPRDMAQIVKYSSGVICVALEKDRMQQLQIDAMVKNNEDPKGTAFGVSVDATKDHGITTGISATDRSRTVQLLAAANTQASDLQRPGHIFPLQAVQGGVLTRQGHTEAAVDLSRLAGCAPVGVLCEIVSEDNPVEMMRLPEMRRFCRKHGYILTSIADLLQYRKDTNQ